MNSKNLTPYNFTLLTLLFSIFVAFLMQETLFDPEKIIYASDHISTLGTRWFRNSFWLSQWDPTRVGGYPTLDATYGSPYHPLMIFHSLIGPARALAWMFATSIILAFCSSTLLASYLSRDWKIGGLFGALFALNPQFFSHFFPGHDGKLFLISIAPLAVYAIIKLCRNNWYWGAPLFGLCSVWAIMSHIQLAYFLLWGILFLSLFENFILDSKSSIKIKLFRQILIGFGLIGGLGISSLQIIPPYKYTTQHSVRSDAQQKSYGHSVSWSNHLEETISIILPGFIGYSVTNENTGKYENQYWGHNPFKLNHDSPGLILLILGLLGLTSRKYWKESAFFSAAISLLILYSVGSNTPLFKFFYEIIPGVKSFRAPSMVLFWIPIICLLSGAPFLSRVLQQDSIENKQLSWRPFALLVGTAFLFLLAKYNWVSAKGGYTGIISISASLGLLFCLKQRYQSIVKIPKGLILTLSACLITLTMLGFSSGPSFETSSYFKTLNQSTANATNEQVLYSFIWLALISISISFLLKSHKNKNQIIIIFLIIGSIGNITTNSPFNKSISKEKVLPLQKQWSAFFKQQMPDSLNDFRVFSLQNQPNSNFGPYYNVRFLQGSHDNKLSTFRSFKGGRSSENFLFKLKEKQTNINNNPFLNLMGVKLLIAQSNQGPQILKNDSAFARTKLYRWNNTYPQAKIPDMLKNGNLDYQNILALDSELSETIPILKPSIDNDSINSRPITIGTSKIVSSSSPSQYTIEANANFDGWLLFNENYHPDWRAKVNNSEVIVSRAFHTLIAIPIPKGHSKIDIKYQSRPVESSKKFVWIGLFIILLLSFFAQRYRNNTLKMDP